VTADRRQLLRRQGDRETEAVIEALKMGFERMMIDVERMRDIQEDTDRYVEELEQTNALLRLRLDAQAHYTGEPV
jgi:hypothetical protein